MICDIKFVYGYIGVFAMAIEEKRSFSGRIFGKSKL